MVLRKLLSRLLLLVTIVFGSQNIVYAQPANDDCSTAQAIGSLPTPSACPSGAGSALSIAGTLNGATAANPYIYQNSCTGAGGASMSSPANDVWYTFVATGYQAVITINSQFTNPNVAFYSGTCGALGGGVGGCAVGTGGSVTLTVEQMVIGTTYYVQVSGNGTQTGNFTMSIQNNNGCTDCLTGSTLTVSPQPVNGMYQPGQAVTFCYHVSDYQQINTNWLHGVQLNFGSGWNVGSITTTPPTACQGSGFWAYYPAGVTSSATGNNFGAGFYFEDGLDTDPGNNFGDDCAGTIAAGTWVFCFTVQVASGCNPGSDLSVTINTSGDGETGSWSNLGCADDPATEFHAVGSCCPPTMASTPSCPSGSTGSATATPVGSSGPYDYVWTDSGGNVVSSTSNVSGNNTVNNLAPGTYTVSLTNAYNCEVTNTVTVSTVSLPVLTASNNGPLCTGNTLNLTAALSPSSSATYSWTGPNGFTAASQNPSVNNITTADAGTYTVTATVSGCTVTGTTTVSMSPPPTVTPGNSGPVCEGSVLNLTTNTVAGATYSWTGPNGFTAASQNPTINSPTTAASGTYTVSVNSNGCVASNTTTVSINPLPTPTASSNSPICEGTDLNLTCSATSGATYAWTGPNGFTSTAQNPVISAVSTAASGNYTVTVTSNGCTGTSTVTVTVNPGPVTTASSNSPICEGSTLNLNATNTGITGTTYSWSGPNGFTAASQNPAISAATTVASGTYTVTVSAAGCSSSSSTTVTVNPIPTTTASSNSPVCEGSVLNLNTTTSSVPGSTYSWSGPNGFTSAVQNPSIAAATLAASGTYTVTVSAAGCSSTATVSTTVNPNADATITPAGPFCAADPVITLTAAQTGGTWSGNGITDPVAGTFDPSLATAGNNTITYSVSGICGDTQTTTIVINSNFDATINPAGPFCQNNAPVTLAAADPGGTWSGTGITNGNTGIFDPAAANIGNNTITYTIPGSCGDTATTVIQVFANSDATINPAGPFCINSGIQTITAAETGGTWSGTGITNSANGSFDPAVAGVGSHVITYTINGVCGDTQSITVVVTDTANTIITPAGPFCVNDPAVTLTAVDPGGTWIGDGVNPSSGIFTPSSAGPGNHVITYTIGGACGTSNSTNILVNALPVLAMSVDHPSGCSPLTATITNNSTGTVNTIWQVNGVNAGTGNLNYTQVFTTPGCYDITMISTDTNGCSNSLTTPSMVCVAGNPVADFDFSPADITILNPTVHFNNLSTNAVSYFWNFANLGNSTTVNPVFTFPDTEAADYNVCLTATSTEGCIDSICKIIDINDEFLVYVPNAFTPDGDGINDLFFPIVSGHDPAHYEFMIFNRWGELIFSATSNQYGWDGTYHGTLSKTEVYVWKLKVRRASDGKKFDYYGHVSLLR